MKLFGYEIKKAANPLTVLLDSHELLPAMGVHGGRICTNTVTGQAQAYASCSILASIITKKVSAIADARYWLQDLDGNDVTKPEELARIKQPNKWQTLSEFVCMVEFFTQIFGKAYIVKVAPVGFGDDFELFVVPNTMVDEVERPVSVADIFTPQAEIAEYRIPCGGATIVLPRDEVYVVNDSSYSFNRMGGTTSRLEVLQEPINTFVSAYQAVTELLVNRGMLGIISLRSDDPATDLAVPSTKADRENLEASLNRYGILRGRMKYAITAFNAAHVPVSSTIRDLGVTDIQRNCKKDIAYTYQVPSILLDVEGSTYSNFGEAKLEFYTGDIIPSANNIMRILNRIYGFEGFGVVATFDHLELFQNAKRQQAAGLVSLVSAINQAVQSGLMTPEQGKDELNKYLI